MSTRWMDGMAGQALVRRSEPGLWDRAFAATAPRPGRDLVSVLQRIQEARDTRDGLLAGALARITTALDITREPELGPDVKVAQIEAVLTAGGAR
jgi:hypothetical protein